MDGVDGDNAHNNSSFKGWEFNGGYVEVHQAEQLGGA